MFSQENLFNDFLNQGKNKTLKIVHQNAKFKNKPNVLKLNIIDLEFIDISSWTSL